MTGRRPWINQWLQEIAAGWDPVQSPAAVTAAAVQVNDHQWLHAYHEAGHVVQPFEMAGRAAPLHSVSIVPDGDSWGRVDPVPNATMRGIPKEAVQPHERIGAFVGAYLGLGGLAAEAVAQGTRAMWSAYEFDSARKHLTSALPFVIVGDRLHKLWNYTCGILAAPVIWAAVVALAEVLEVERELDGPRAWEIVERTMQEARALLEEHQHQPQQEAA